MTSSKDKHREAERILGERLYSEALDFPEHQAIGVKEISEEKARYAYAKLKQPVMVEDTGLHVALVRKSLRGA